MKRSLTRSFAVAALVTSNLTSFAQANDWIIPPSTKIRFNTGSPVVSTLPGTSAIAACGPGSIYDYLKYTGVISDAAGNGMAFVNNCGIYNTSGSSIGTGSYQNVFVVPGVCKSYYALNWEDQWGPPHYNALVFRQLDATNPSAITEIGSSNIILDYSMHTGAIAVAPLAADGSRKIYIADNSTLKLMTIYSNGTRSAVSNLATLPAQVDNRTRMEVSPDGSKVLMVHLGNFASAYDVTGNYFTTIGSFPAGTIISGIEYVPYSGGDRIYFSFHTSGGAAGISYVTTSAPTTMNAALSSIPPSTAQYGYGYTEIERAKDGKLYFAYHPNYTSTYVLSGDVGKLCSMDPATGVVNPVNNGATQVNVNTVEYNWSYLIQRQIDGENYNMSTHMAPTPSFTIAGMSAPTSPSDLYICNNTLPINVTIPGVHTGYTVTASTGSAYYDGAMGKWMFLYNLTQPAITSYSITNTATSHSTNMMDYLSYLNSYTGYIYVTVTAIGCGGNASYSMIYNFQGNTNTFTDFKAVKYNGGVKMEKNLQTTIPITAAMPVGTTTSPADLQTAVDLVVGWCTANATMGIRNINTNTIGGSYSCKVYEAKDSIFYNTTLGRMDTLMKRQNTGGVNAPDIYRKTFSGKATNALIDFNNETVTFDGTKPPYYVDSSIGFTDVDWFREYYKWAYDNTLLTSYSSKQYCVEVTVVTSTGCTNTKKSYFRIANNGLKNGAGARIVPINAHTTTEVSLYPNPAKDHFQVDLPTEAQTAKIVLVDILGKVVLTQDDIRSGYSFNISTLPAGTYLYQISVDGVLTRGKLVKQ